MLTRRLVSIVISALLLTVCPSNAMAEVPVHAVSNGGSPPPANPSVTDSPPSESASAGDPPPTEGTGLAGLLDTSTAVLTVKTRGSSPVTSEGRNGRPESAAPTEDEAAPSAIGTPDPCFYLPLSDAEAIAAGYDPSKGTLSSAKCPVQSNLPGLPDGVRYVTREVWTLNGEAPAPPPPPDPAELARSVASQLTVPAPVLHAGSPGERVAVKVPVWLWVDEQPALTASVSAGGLTVTARAVLSSVDWSMGEPVGDPGEGPSGQGASFSCTGAGSPPPAGVGRSVVPPCGYTFTWRSDVGRTGGSGAWPVQAVAHWTMTWQATNGAAGAIPLQATAATQVPVGEWRVALVDGGGTH